MNGVQRLLKRGPHSGDAFPQRRSWRRRNRSCFLGSAANGADEMEGIFIQKGARGTVPSPALLDRRRILRLLKLPPLVRLDGLESSSTRLLDNSADLTLLPKNMDSFNAIEISAPRSSHDVPEVPESLNSSVCNPRFSLLFRLLRDLTRLAGAPSFGSASANSSDRLCCALSA